MGENTFQVSQGYDIILPKRGLAYPILCEEWDHLKTQVRGIKTSFGTYHTIGSIMIGAALTTLIAIFLGAYSVAATADPTILIVAWAVTVTTGISGITCLYFAGESRTISERQADEVVRQMELIEKRYAHSEV
jgi:hypothetical protein